MNTHRHIRTSGSEIMNTPKELDLIADVVLRYKPRPKSKASKRRARKKRQADAKKG
jgi:hypothetical protein